MSKFKNKVQEVLRQYYYEHHDKIRMEQDLTETLELESISGLQQVIESIDTRMAHLRHDLTYFEKLCSSDVVVDKKARIDELEALGNYVKELMLKRDTEIKLVPPPDQL